MNENKIVEYIVQKKAGGREIGLRLLIILLAALISLVTTFFLGIYGLIFTFFAVFFAIYFYKYTLVEYEYLIIGNEMTIDVIYGKTKRKEIQKFDLSRAELITTPDSEKAAYYAKATQMPTFDYTSGYERVPGVEDILIITGYGASTAKVYLEGDAKVRDYFKSMFPSKCYL